MSMAAGEYVSVSSQADTEEADIARERKELASDGDSERAELAGIYVSRGLDPDLALQVDRIAPLHGRVVPLAELYTTAGRPLPR